MQAPVLNLIPAFNSCALVVGRYVSFKEVAFNAAGTVSVGNVFQLLVRIGVKTVIHGFQANVFQAFVGNEFCVLFNSCRGDTGDV